MSDLYSRIAETAAFIKSLTECKPLIGIVLGTGLGGLVKEITIEAEIPYEEIPHFPVSTVKGHAGKMIFGLLGNHKVMAMAGRFHYYEGYDMQQITFPIRVMKEMGVKMLIISNAAGSVNAKMEAGDMVFLNGHINLMPSNPLIGPNDDRLGVRFPDMLHTYNPKWISRALDIAKKKGYRAHQGVYTSLPGPNLETPAEYRYMNLIGSDLVGMSTVPEVLVAKHSEIEVLALSVVSNKCFPIEEIRETSLEDVLQVVGEAEPKVTNVVKEFISSLNF